MARPFLFLVHLFALLALVLGALSMPADRPRANRTSIFSRGKQDVIMGCTNSKFLDLIEDGFVVAESITANTLEHLDLLFSLFEPDESGRLRPEKMEKSQRTFDEDNVFSAYNFFIRRLYDPDKPELHKDAFQAMRETRALATTMHEAISKWNAGESRPGFPNLQVYCDEDEYLKEKMPDGTTFVEGRPYRKNPDSHGQYTLARKASDSGDMPGTFQWFRVYVVCAQRPGQTHRTFEGDLRVPTDQTWLAYVDSGGGNRFDPVMTFCPMAFPSWEAREVKRLTDGLDIQRLNVPIGGTPTEYQKAALEKLIDERSDLSWLGEGFVATLLHELSHAAAFTPPGRTLLDIECVKGPEEASTAGSSDCLAMVAKGEDGLDDDGLPQGHKDAEAFAIFNMAMWVNSATWWRAYEARRRSRNPPPQR
ncbi:hypothetical protein J3F83DRAFT_740306 [Trichoderma novae-zelandiae]